MKETIRQRARELGFDECRFTTAQPPDHAAEFQRWLASQKHGEMNYLARNAHRRVDPRQVLPGARTVITLATSYYMANDLWATAGSRNPAATNNSNLQASTASRRSGTIARYARFDDYHDVLGGRVKELTEAVSQLGGADTRSLWYVDTGPLLERDLAQRAGLGFVGKHTNLISRRLGNWIFLAEILTTLELEPDPAERNHCGGCTRCIAACPTAAITAPFQLDARRCISYLTIELKGPIPERLRPAMGDRIYGCDDCLAVCPWNRFAREGALMKAHSRPEFGAADLIELLSLDEARFRKRFAGTPMLRARRKGLLRNVCVALGNVGDETALAAMKKASADPEPLIAEHARWAITQIESRSKASPPK